MLIKRVKPVSFEDAYPILTLSTHKEPWGSVVDGDPSITCTSEQKNSDQFNIFSNICKSSKK